MKKLSVLDYGCGRGGDIQKFFHAKIDNYVGFDPDSHGIHSSTNGAISRYNNFRRKMPNFPNMDFLIGDGSALLDLESQEKAVGKMSDSNKHLIETIFGKNADNLSNRKFDVFNCQLMIHFLLKNDTTWNNFCTNVNNFLEDDGYILISCFDGQMIHDLFNKNLGRIEQKYTTDEGVSKKFFEYKSSYDYKTKDINRTGLSYNAFVTMLKEEGNYDTEYLVTEDFLKKSLKEKCNMDLVESTSFYDIYKQKTKFFEDVAPKEENVNSKNYFMKVSEFYNQEDSVNQASLEFSKLHKYYVFKKRSGAVSRPVKKEAKVEVKTKTRRVTKKETSKKTSSKKTSSKKTSSKKTSRKSKESIKVKKPSKKNNLIDKYLKSSNVLDI
jgi:SAM-dependent methyltransferase